MGYLTCFPDVFLLYDALFLLLLALNILLFSPRFKPVPLLIALTLNATAFADEASIDVVPVQLESLSVVGTKRAQTAQEVTQSLVILEEKDFIGFERLTDAVKAIPNITYETGSFLPTVRGLDGNGVAMTSGGAVSGARPRMSVYVDGVARSYSSSPDGDSSFWDVEQVEVYRGAQSTQLGRNSLAGAIVQKTYDPKFKDEYAAQVGARDENATYSAAFMANKKINDQFAIRVTGETIRGSSFIDYSDFDGTGLSDSNRDDLGDIRFNRFRLKALFEPTAMPDLSIKLTLDSERSGRIGSENQVDLQEDRKLVGAGNYSYLRNYNSVSSLSANYLLTDEWDLNGILSYQRVSTNFGPPIVGEPNARQYFDFSFDVYETTFESKLNYLSATNRTNAVMGLFVMQRSRRDSGAPGSQFVLDAEDRSKTVSLFADAAIEIAANWDLLLGGRLERDQQKRDFGGQFFAGPFVFDQAFNFDETNDVFLPKLGATYHVSSDASVSLVAYKGYTASGGGVSNRTFTPYLFDKETAVTTELSTRTQWLDRKLTANANVFYTKLKDLQASGIGPAGPLDRIFINLDKVKTYGAEFELSYQANRQDLVAFSLGLLQTEIENTGSVANDANNGNELATSPHVTARLVGRKELYRNFSIGGDVAYVAERFSDYQNVDANEVGSYTMTNLNAQYRYKNVIFTAFVNNVFDKNALTSDLRATGGLVNVTAPRTVGGNIRVDF